MQSVPIAQASAGTSSGSRAPALRPAPKKRPRLSRLTVEINTAGFSKLYNVAPWKNLPKHRSLDKNSTHRDWCNAFGDVGHSSQSKVCATDISVSIEQQVKCVVHLLDVVCRPVCKHDSFRVRGNCFCKTTVVADRAITLVCVARTIDCHARENALGFPTSLQRCGKCGCLAFTLGGCS